MVRFLNDIASLSDDDELREIVSKTYMKGEISLSFESEPSFFNSIAILGESQEVLIIRDLENEKIIGFMIKSIKNVFINGHPKKVRYLSSLRLLEEYRRGRLMHQGFKYLKSFIDDSNMINFTTIIEDNIFARDMLTSSRAGLPNYLPIGKMKTFIIKPTSRVRYKSKTNIKIEKGISKFSLKEIINFLNKEGSKKDFFPVYTEEIFNKSQLRDFDINNLYIAHNETEILGVVGVWDQTRFKQTVVKALSNKYKLLKPFNNYILSPMCNYPLISNPGKIRSFYINLIAIKDNNPDIFSLLIDKISLDNSNYGYNYFIIGLSEDDNLCLGLKNFRSLTYDSILYLVDYKRTVPLTRTPYLEISRL